MVALSQIGSTANSHFFLVTHAVYGKPLQTRIDQLKIPPPGIYTSATSGYFTLGIVVILVILVL